MRIFVNAGVYPSYFRHFNASFGGRDGFEGRRAAYLSDRFGSAHFLKPVLDREHWATFTIGNDPILQQLWHREHTGAKSQDLERVLLNQIEEHRTEVFYNLDPLSFGSAFVRKLPGCVKHTLCWRAAPSPGADFIEYDRVICNFPSILKRWESLGCKTALFYPAHDPEMDAYASNSDRPIDICFVGGFSRHHSRRTVILDAVAALRDRFDIRYFLDISRVTKVAEFIPGPLWPMSRYRRTAAIRAVCRKPIFGRTYYQMLGRTKIVLNGAIDMAHSERGNLRCFEAMGCGCLLVSDEGSYPKGMVNERTMRTYSSVSELLDTVERSLAQWDKSIKISANGHAMVRKTYNKDDQWQDFLRIVQEV